jgi:hypothetical protein
MIDGGRVLVAGHFNCGRGGASCGLAQAGFQVTGHTTGGSLDADGEVVYPYKLVVERGAGECGPVAEGACPDRVRRRLRLGYDYDLVWATAYTFWEAAGLVDLLATHYGGRPWAVELHEPAHPSELPASLEYWADLHTSWRHNDGLDGEAGQLSAIVRRHAPCFMHVGRSETRVLFSNLWALSNDAIQSGPIALADSDVSEGFELQSKSMFDEGYPGGVLEMSDQCPWLSREQAGGETHPGIARTVGFMARAEILGLTK